MTQIADRFDLVRIVVTTMFGLGRIAAREIVEGGQLGNHSEAATVGNASPKFSAMTIRDRHASARHRMSSLERRHPNDRVRLSLLEMHREIGDQRRRRNIHRAW